MEFKFKVVIVLCLIGLSICGPLDVSDTGGGLDLDEPLGLDLDEHLVDIDFSNVTLETDDYGFVTGLPDVPEAIGRSLIDQGLLGANDRGGRIINGNMASTNQFPHYVYIVIYRKANGVSTAIFCGSTLVHTKWLVSAAHCLSDAYAVTAYLGSNDKQTTKQSRSSDGFAQHQNFNSPTPLANDISIIRLSTAATTSASVQPIRLPARSDTLIPFANKLLVASGFGKTLSDYPRYLYFTYLVGMTDADCRWNHWVYIESMLCAKGYSSGASVCYGDSGGPLITDENGVKTFVGINSYVQSDNCINDVDGFTRVDHYLDWITWYASDLTVRN